MDTAVKEVVGHYIGGQLVSGSSGRFGDVYNPATGDVARTVALASADEVRRAIDNAAEAWQLVSAKSQNQGPGGFRA